MVGVHDDTPTPGRAGPDGYKPPPPSLPGVRLAPGARRYALLAGAAGLAAAFAFPPALVVGLVAAAFVLWFHRDPDRRVAPRGAVAPADGRVTVVREEGDRVRVGVFMSPTDVHVNRAPLGGRVTAVTHEPGGHWPAFSKASERNERVRIRFAEPDYELVLVAGAFARRIHPSVAAGDAVERGARVGHISFGSRADVVLPADVDRAALVVAVGDRVRAGETMVADRDV